jgi:FSR family fosmidomycin resistance protein-like MFS transporter
MIKKIKPDKEGFQTTNIVLISLSHLLHDIYTSFLAPILPLLIQKFNISLFLSGLLSVAHHAPSLLNPFVGILAERVKVRYFVIFAPAITTVAMGMIGIAPFYTILIVLLLISGISSTMFHVPAPVMIKKVSGDRTGKGMSFFMLGGELARSLGPLIIVAAVELWGLKGTTRLIPFGILASFILWLKLRNIPISDEVKTKSRNSHYLKVLKQFSSVFINLAGITLFRGAMKSALTLYLPVYLVGKGSELWMAGISLSILQLAGAAGTFYSGSISDKIGRRTTLVIVCIVSPVLMFLFLNSTGTLSLILLVLMGIFLVAPMSVNLAIIHDLDTDHLPFVNGVYMGLNFFISSLMTMGVGALSDRIGLDKTYSIAAFISFAAIFFAMRIPSSKRTK